MEKLKEKRELRNREVRDKKDFKANGELILKKLILILILTVI